MSLLDPFFLQPWAHMQMLLQQPGQKLVLHKQSNDFNLHQTPQVLTLNGCVEDIFIWGNIMIRLMTGINDFKIYFTKQIIRFPLVAWIIFSGAYVKRFLCIIEDISYDTEQLYFAHRLVCFIGTYAKFILPLLIVIVLLTYLTTAGMIGSVIVQSLTNLRGQGIIHDAKIIGAWSDHSIDRLILYKNTLLD